MNEADQPVPTSKKQGERLRVPPVDSAAWATLYGKLIEAARADRAGAEYPGAPAGFAAMETGLQAVVQFLLGCDGLMREGAVVPLHRLSVALRDLQEGRKPVLLAPRAQGGNPGTDNRRAALIGFAARAMTEIMLSGSSSDAAARKVVDALRRGNAAGVESITAEKVKNWRARCEEGRPDHRRGAVSLLAWQHYVEPLPPSMGSTPADRAASLLHVLSEAAARGLGDTASQQPPVFVRKTSG